MSENNWQRLGPVAEQVTADTARRSGVVIQGPWPDADTQRRDRLERDQEFKTECALFAEAIYRCSARSERRIGIKSVRGILAAVLQEVDEQIERDDGSAA